MTLLTTVQGVAAVVGVTIPDHVFPMSSASRTAQEMIALANEMVQRITGDTREWTQLKLVNTFTGDGLTEAFTLPANFKRMLLAANLWRSSRPALPLRFIPNTDEWINRRMRGYVYPYGEWTIFGGQMHIMPLLGAGETATFVYLDKNAVNLASGGVGDNFMDDADSFRLDERLLKLGMIWQWKANKGSPYAEDMGTWSDAMVMAMGTDQPAPILVGRTPISAHVNAGYAFPYPVPTP